jgi:LPXTG-motif cell wall-anchored protein
MEMKIIKSVLAVAALVILGAMSLSSVRADEWNKKTVMTFNQPVEIPGQILPAGTYTFKLLDSPSDRHVVQIFTADGMHIIATVLAINNYRLRPTGQTVVKFSERPGDAPDALKAWFYPGDNFGQEFVYPKPRAIELAVALKEPIPALPAEATDLNTAPIVAVTPEQKEVPVTEAIETTDPAPVAETVTPAPVAETMTPAPVVEAKELPKTASSLPLIALLGFASLGLALVVKRFS